MGSPGFAGAPAPRTPEGLGGIGYATGTEPPAPSTGVVSAAEGSRPGSPCCATGRGRGRLSTSAGRSFTAGPSYAGLPGVRSSDHQRPWRAVELLQRGPRRDPLRPRHGPRARRLEPRLGALRTLSPRRHHTRGGVGLALARTERIVEEVQGETPIVDDLLVEFDLATGEPLRSLSLWDALAASPFAELLTRLTVREGDVMHANGLALLDADFCEALDVPGLEAGAVLVSMRDLDLVVAVDLDAGRAVWVTSGPRASRWRGLHDPRPGSTTRALPTSWCSTTSAAPAERPGSSTCVSRTGRSRGATGGPAERLRLALLRDRRAAPHGTSSRRSRWPGACWSSIRRGRVLWEYASPIWQGR